MQMHACVNVCLLQSIILFYYIKYFQQSNAYLDLQVVVTAFYCAKAIIECS